MEQNANKIIDCKIHRIAMKKCKAENCTSNDVCTLCELNSKAGLQHLADHFDFLEDRKGVIDLEQFKMKLKNEEIYNDLNLSYIEKAQALTEKIDDTFNQIQKYRNIIIDQCSEAMLLKYDNTTAKFENLIKTLTEKVDNLTSTDSKMKNEVSKLKKDLDDTVMFLNDQSLIRKGLDEFTEKSSQKLLMLRIQDLLDQRFSFNTKGIPCLLEWNMGGRVYTSRGGSSYYTCKSMEVLSGQFLAKVKVVNINVSYAGSNWNYSIGLMRASSLNETSYYNDSCILMSNGYLAGQFSGSNGSNLFPGVIWKNGDVLIVKRDEKDDVYFGINDENSLKLGFSRISGDYKLILGFSSSMTGDTFELEELDRY